MNLYVKRALFTLLLVAPLAMVGCANLGPTAFSQAEELGQEGYSHSKLSEGKYRVIFSGNRVTNKHMVRDFALLHAADLTIENGYDWFVVTESENEIEQSTVVKKAHVNPAPARIDKHCGLVSCTTTIYPQSNDINVVTERKLGNLVSTLFITMGKGISNAPERAYVASELADTIRNRDI